MSKKFCRSFPTMSCERKPWSLSLRGISARDAGRVAVMEEARVERIMSFDPGFDTVPGRIRVFA